ncbi:hypothetical protein A2U01_0089462, partial [Trifolium medium]|nr:hypothetical protein [Trifolium medium]
RKGGDKGATSGAHRDGYIQTLDRETTSFFFTNIPKGVKAMDLWPRFARYARVGEVYIPKSVSSTPAVSG